MGWTRISATDSLARGAVESILAHRSACADDMGHTPTRQNGGRFGTGLAGRAAWPCAAPGL
eukprot:7943971-Alexandrium_andersonii.AAC.1